MRARRDATSHANCARGSLTRGLREPRRAKRRGGGHERADVRRAGGADRRLHAGRAGEQDLPHVRDGPSRFGPTVRRHAGAVAWRGRLGDGPRIDERRSGRRWRGQYVGRHDRRRVARREHNGWIGGGRGWQHGGRHRGQRGTRRKHRGRHRRHRGGSFGDRRRRGSDPRRCRRRLRRRRRGPRREPGRRERRHLRPCTRRDLARTHRLHRRTGHDRRWLVVFARWRRRVER